MRILFVPDLHASDLVLKKALKAVRDFEATVFIMSGDLTGKDLRPIVHQDDGSYELNSRGRIRRVNQADVSNAEEELAGQGHYFVRCTKGEYQRLFNDERAVADLISCKASERLDSWLTMIALNLDLRYVCALVTPGNDDHFGLDAVIKHHEPMGIRSALETPVNIGTNEIVSLDYSNPTPWNTPRELPEERLEKTIYTRCERLLRPERAIFDFHCPPIRTKLDLAPEIDNKLRPVITPGGDNKVHVGSVAVRKAIERYQPVLSLHGHVHESPGIDHIGSTVCLNPGSEYESGLLRGFLVDIDGNGNVATYHRIEG